MKRLLQIFGAVFIFVIISAFAYTTENKCHSIDVREINVGGHKYVIASSFYDSGLKRFPGGVSIIHSEGCYCRNKH